MIYNVNPQLNNKQYLQQYPIAAGQNFSADGRLSSEEIKNKVQDAANDNFVGKAVAADKNLSPLTYAKNFALCILMSLGFTHGTNWLGSSKEFGEATNAVDFTQTRMYKLANKADEYLAGNSVSKAIGNGLSRTKSSLARIPVPEFLKEVWGKIKMGTRSQWDKTGNYTIGKGGEAMNEAMEFLSKVSVDEIKKLGLAANDQKTLLELLKQYNSGRITGIGIYKDVAKILDKAGAAKLSKLSTGPLGWLNTIFRTRPNVNMALHKAKFFNGFGNQGPIAKGIQKLISLVGEASGGGTLGGGSALLMNAFGLMTAFNAASEAEKGDKLSAFMEDYIGYTLGSYLMSFFVGKCMHRALGVAELGMDKAAIERVGQALGVDMSRGCLNDVVIAYNRMFKKSSTIQSAMDGLFNGKMTVAQALDKVKEFKLDNVKPNMTKLELHSALKRELAEGKKVSELLKISDDIRAAYKSKLTLKSIFKADSFNTGNFWQRLGRYVVQKPLSIIGKVASIGKYDLFSNGRLKIGNKTFFENGSKMVKSLKWAKRFGGGLGRIFLVMFVLTPPFAKLFGKISHAIFGKPQKSKFDEEKKGPDGKQIKAQEIQKLLAPSKPDGTNALGMTQEEVKLLKSKGLKDEEIIQAGMYVNAQKQQLKKLLETTDKNGVNALGLTQQEMKTLRDKGLNDTEILQVAAYKKQVEQQSTRQKEIAAAAPVESHNLLKRPIASSSIKGYQSSSAPNRRYVPSSKCNIKPASVPENLMRDMQVADMRLQDAENILNGKGLEM